MRRTLQRYFVDYLPKGVATGAQKPSNPHLITQAFRRTEVAAQKSDEAISNKGFYFAPKLDYDTAMGVAPLLSREQFALQQVFHRDAIDTLNQLTIGTELEGHSLDVVIRKTSFDATRAAIHTAAAEHFNYCFWYKSLRPWGVSVPSVLREELQLQYSRNGMLDGVEEVQRLMLLSAQNQLSRCGWVYLVWTGRMFDVLEFSHGTCPIGSGLVPLLALNVHTSSFAHDYAPLDPNGDDGLEIYVHNFFKTCNWGLAHRYFTEANVKE